MSAKTDDLDDAAVRRLRATMLAYLEPHVGHGDDLQQIWSDLREWVAGGPVTWTADPASWSEWVEAYWRVRGVVVRWSGTQHELASDPSVTVALPPNEDPVWSQESPAGDGTAVVGEELRQFVFFRTYVAQRYHARESLEAFVAALRSTVEPLDLPGWVDAWTQSGLKEWSPGGL